MIKQIEKSNDKKKVFSKRFLITFLIPSIIWLLLSLLSMIPDKNETDSLTWVEFFIGNITILGVWFAISYVIATFHKEKVVNKEEKVLKKYIFPLIMGITSFFIGSFFVYETIGVPLKAELEILVFSYLPTLLFILNTILMYKFHNSKKIITTFHILSIILTCILFIYYFIAIFIIVAIQAVNSVSNPIFYKHYVSGTYLTKVFPKNIPKNVDNVQFHYNPPLLQGGSNYYLYYVDENMTSEKFDKKYKSKSMWVGHKEKYNEKKGLLSGDLLMYSKESYYKKQEHENDFVIYLVEGKCDDSGWCNHGEFLYTAFNNKTKEIIYRAEKW